MKRVIATCLLAASCAAVVSTPALAGKNYYRWVNERGNVVHSDRPPAQGIDYEVVDSISYHSRQIEVDGETGEPENGAQEQPKKAAAPAVPTLKPTIIKNPEKCEAARTNLAKLDSTARIRMRNKEGEMVFLSPEQKGAEREKAVKTIEVHCE